MTSAPPAEALIYKLCCSPAKLYSHCRLAATNAGVSAGNWCSPPKSPPAAPLVLVLAEKPIVLASDISVDRQPHTDATKLKVEDAWRCRTVLLARGRLGWYRSLPSELLRPSYDNSLWKW